MTYLTDEDINSLAKDPKAFLAQAYHIERLIGVKKRRIEHLRQLSVQITQTIKPVTVFTGPGDKIANSVIEITDLTRELNEDIARLLDLQRKAAEAIAEFVPDRTQRAVLEARYLAGMSWEDIAYTFRYAYRWVLRLHKKALAAMQANAAKEGEE